MKSLRAAIRSLRERGLVPRTAALATAAVAMVALVVGLLYLNERSAQTLRENFLSLHAQHVELRAVTLGSAIAAANEELRQLVQSREVAAFHESRDLGMSMQYGLAMTLVPIVARLRAMSQPQDGAASTFHRVVYLDQDGTVLADSGEAESRQEVEPPGPDGVVVDRERLTLVATRSLRLRGKVAGRCVGWIRPERLREALGQGQGWSADGPSFTLVSADGRWWRPLDVPAGPGVDPQAVPADGRPRMVRGREGAPEVAVRLPLAGLPFSLLHEAPADGLLGGLAPSGSRRTVTVAALLVLALVLTGLVVNVKAMVLQARLAESLRREQEVAEKHAALERAVAERDRLEERLRHAHRLEAVGKLAGGVAHDFNNLLSVILGYTGLVLEQLPTDSPQHGDLDEVRRAAGRAAELTRQLLAFGRRQVLKPQLVDLASAQDGTRKMLARLVGDSVELVTEAAPGLPAVRVDPGQLDQVLVNLVVNARDAMPEGGRITVSTDEVTLDEAAAARYQEGAPGRYVRLRVADQGTGFAPEALEHLFEPFFTTKERGRGTGLGLSTVFGILRQSHGFVGVTSRPGAGTTVEVFLPAAEEAAAPSEVRAAPARTAVVALPGETVLLAEDDPQVRRLICSQLTAAGFAVLTAADGQEALELDAARQGPIDALVSDVAMPRLSGARLAAAFRSRHPGAPVILMSGFAGEVVAGEPQVSGSVLVQKPDGLTELPGLLRRLLDTARPA